MVSKTVLVLFESHLTMKTVLSAVTGENANCLQHLIYTLDIIEIAIHLNEDVCTLYV